MHHDDALVAAPSSFTAAIITSATHIARRHPLKLGTYLLSLLLALTFHGFTPSPSAEAAHARLWPSERAVSDVLEAETRVGRAYALYTSSRGWFWACDALCTQRYDTYVKQREDMAAQRAVLDAQMAAANAQLGVLSSPAIAHTRRLFWASFDSGARSARDMSYWDATWMSLQAVLGSREESVMSLLLQWVAMAVWNFIFAMVTVVIAFSFRVWEVLRAYGASWPVSIAFWLAATLAAAAWIATMLGVLIGGGAAAVAGVAYVLGPSSRRIDNGGSARGGRGSRPHLRQD